MRDRVVESIQEIKRFYMSRKSLFSSPAPKSAKSVFLVAHKEFSSLKIDKKVLDFCGVVNEKSII
jgi:hypothetical protein